eukprot:TRINITY_DN3665_c0_g2_i1.p1 TRINITY_DN3665_c0_g2~~TRINITY_DN3665_c0_g2_i1.p1  ORF type:complete len:312 (+),score=60.95 TRINITY_DN3665_c0_g2_i1:137-1072(+)
MGAKKAAEWGSRQAQFRKGRPKATPRAALDAAYSLPRGVAALLTRESLVMARRGNYRAVEQALLREFVGCYSRLDTGAANAAALAAHMGKQGFARPEAELAREFDDAKRLITVFWKCGVAAPVEIYRTLLNKFRELREWDAVTALVHMMTEVDRHEEEALVIKCLAAKHAAVGDIAAVVDLLRQFRCDDASAHPADVLRRIASVRGSLLAALQHHKERYIVEGAQRTAASDLARMLHRRILDAHGALREDVEGRQRICGEPPQMMRQNIDESVRLVAALLCRCPGAGNDVARLEKAHAMFCSGALHRPSHA